MKKLLSTPRTVLSLSFVFIICGNINGEMSMTSAIEVTAALQKIFRSGCVYVLQTEEKTIFGNIWFQHLSLMVVVLEYQ
jgi:hypothetical protein